MDLKVVMMVGRQANFQLCRCEAALIFNLIVHLVYNLLGWQYARFHLLCTISSVEPSNSCFPLYLRVSKHY